MHMWLCEFIQKNEPWCLSDMGSIQFRNWNSLFQTQMELEMIILGLEIEVCYKKIHKLVYSLLFLIQKYFFHDNLEYKLLGVGIWSRHSKYLFQSVIGIGKK